MEVVAKTLLWITLILMLIEIVFFATLVIKGVFERYKSDTEKSTPPLCWFKCEINIKGES